MKNYRRKHGIHWEFIWNWCFLPELPTHPTRGGRASPSNHPGIGLWIHIARQRGSSCPGKFTRSTWCLITQLVFTYLNRMHHNVYELHAGDHEFDLKFLRICKIIYKCFKSMGLPHFLKTWWINKSVNYLIALWKYIVHFNTSHT